MTGEGLVENGLSTAAWLGGIFVADCGLGIGRGALFLGDPGSLEKVVAPQRECDVLGSGQ
ncbi:hypothetical protein RMSM_05359 [Rhodopirellula maiorica SM1]|uniref:Uncharacterized protein n=1 Tax=Rhodopirellula maiorica SM1 TaxID=1265738 RepID=M5REB6_9BACT|nr:hypothetical protein RMSM_05359 [Rhodopirellula maiorica SM1]